MLSLRPRKLLCEVYEDHLVLREAGKCLAECELTDEALLEETIENLIAPHVGRMPWLNTLGLWLDSSRVHHFTVPWQEGIAQREDLRAWAASQAAAQWPGGRELALKTDFIDVSYASTALAAAIDDRLWLILLRVARAQKLRADGIAVEFQVQLQPWLRQMPEDALFCLRGVHSSIYAARQAGQWQQVWRLNNDSETNEHQQLALVARLMGLSSDAPRHFLNTSHHALNKAS